MATPVTDFSRRCIDELPGIPPPTVDRLVREKGREMVRLGRLWSFDYPDITTVDGTFVYQLDQLPECSQLYGLRTVTYDDASGNPYVWAWKPTADRCDFVSYGATSVKFASDATLGGTLRLRLWLQPTPDACDLPDVLWDNWLEPLVHGVKAEAMMQSRKEWSDPAAGQMHYRKYLMDGKNRLRDMPSNGDATKLRTTGIVWPI